MRINDQYNGDPSYAELHVLTRSRPLAREMLKQADFVAKKASVDDLPSTAFAWEDERRFPIHTKEDALASLLYRSKVASSVPEHVDAKLTKAAEVYGLKHVVAAQTKEAHEKVAYALPESQRLPLDSKAEVLLAEHVLTRDYDRLPLEKRAEAFSNLAAAAKKHAVTLSPTAIKLAGLSVCDTATVKNWVEARAAATTGKYQEAFDKLASALETAPPQLSNRKELVKLASLISELDRKAGLDKHYDRKLPDPLLTVFNTEKVAEEMCDVAGMQVPCMKLMSIPQEVWDQLDASEVGELAQANDMPQFKAVFETLPLDVKMVLRRQLGG